ncbi:hypothetical protein BOQ60_11745 [Chryseobacterium sp. CH1]|nr:hypothetical protein BOQ60_11745 [Chryseobacterium sp. CH1]
METSLDYVHLILIVELMRDVILMLQDLVLTACVHQDINAALGNVSDKIILTEPLSFIDKGFLFLFF